MVRLLLAHCIGDFLLQSTTLCEKKKSIPALSGWGYQALHALIYTATVYVFIAEWQCWTLPLLVGGTHFACDVAKAFAEQRMTPPAGGQRGADEGNKPFIDRKKMMLFLLDQIFHLGVLVGVYFRLSGSLDLPPIIDWTAGGICALAYLVVLKPTAVFIQIFFSGFAHTTDKKSLPLADLHRLFGAGHDRILHFERMDGGNRLPARGQIGVSFWGTAQQQRAHAHRIHLAGHFPEFHGGRDGGLARSPSA